VQVSLRIAPEVLSTVIPFLSLQPLVENAVRHGLEAKERPGHITISANDAGAFAEVTIEDDGVGMDPVKLQSMLAGHVDGEHVGLRNVDARLRQVYGDEHGLVIETAPGEGTLITMRVPTRFRPPPTKASRCSLLCCSALWDCRTSWSASTPTQTGTRRGGPP
jgi:two-component system, LytTR family, sensor kinase